MIRFNSRPNKKVGFRPLVRFDTPRTIVPRMGGNASWADSLWGRPSFFVACRVRARCADDQQRSSVPRRAPELYSQFADTTLVQELPFAQIPHPIAVLRDGRGGGLARHTVCGGTVSLRAGHGEFSR